MIKILVVGQTPPPYGGQAISIQLMLDGKYNNVQFHHVRLAFSREMDDIGRFQLTKIWHLLFIIISIIYCRVHYQTPILYYVPAGPNRIPMYRDFAILICTRWLFKKTVFQFRAAGISEIYNHLNHLERFLFRVAYFNVDLAIRLSEFTPDDGAFLQATKNIIVPNGMEDVYAKVGDRSKRGRPVPKLLYVGVLQVSKGVMVMLEACRKLKGMSFLFRARFMGKFESPEFEEKARAYVAESGLSDYVEFLGVLTGDAQWDVYNETDLFVFPSFFESEAMPRSVLEAMNFEIPVIAAAWRGIPSLVEDGESGFLIPIKNSRALADKIAILLENPLLRESMGKRGREIYLEKFTVEKFWRNMEEAFLSVA